MRDAPLFVAVEQRGIDLVVEARRSGQPESVTTDLPNGRWGVEVLLLEAQGWYHIEVHPGQPSSRPGHYEARIEELPDLTGERARAASAMSRAGRLWSAKAPDARSQALAAYREAAKAWHSLGERRWEAEALHLAAILEGIGGEVRPAIEDCTQSLALWRELADSHREAGLLRELGLSLLAAGEVEPARDALERSRSLWQSLGEPADMGTARLNLCYLEQKSGSLQKALACYDEARALFRDLGDSSQEVLILNNLGGIYELMGEPDEALDYYGRGLALRQALRDRMGEVESLNNLAVVHRALGEWQEALRLYDQMREILATIDSPFQVSTLLNNIGSAYNSLGEPERARVYLEKALEMRRTLGDRPNEIVTLNNLGLVWRGLGDLQKALDHHQKALDLAVTLNNQRQEAVTRRYLAEVQLEQGDSAAALREIDPALERLREMGLRRAEAEALHLRGRALLQAGRPSDALPVLEEALKRRRDLHQRVGEVDTLQVLAAAERSLGLQQKARDHAEEAVRRVEELRTGFVNPSLRAAFLATQRRAYGLLIDLLMDQHTADPAGGHNREAFAVSERARARSLLDVLHTGNAVPAGSTIPAGLIERRQSLRRRLSAKASQQLAQPQKADALGGEIETLLAELDGVEAEMRRQDPRYAAVSAPRQISPQEIADLLGPGTLLLEYSLGEDRSFLWAAGAAGLRTFTLPPAREIEALARRTYDELRTVETGARSQGAAEELGRKLLGPAWSEAALYQRLIIVPDAALHLLPFSALPVPAPGKGWESPARKPLLESHEVVYLPSATTLVLERQRLEGRKQAPKWAMVLADPVFAPDDSRLAAPTRAALQAENRAPKEKDVERGGPALELVPVFERLAFSRKEAEGIAALAPGQVSTALDLEASREKALSGELRSYRVVHFATHAVADARNPELSGLVLSLVDAAGHPRDGFLGLTDLYELELDADLVVLSGCQTALGREVRGEGLMGLTRGFLYAGVPRVVASLWKVQDRTTAELMKRFYGAMWKQGLSPAAALREAQRSLRSDVRYSDPYYWAGFVLQGDWRWSGQAG